MILRDRVAIVTGGARGLGKAYVLRLLEEGAKVVIADILEPKWVNQTVIERKGGDILVLHTDVSEEESTKQMAQKTIEHFEKIDILINNAAMSADVKTKPFYEISVQEWDKVMQVNLRGTFLCCKAVFPQMKKQGKGKIINISSGTFFEGGPRFIHYISSKGGIVAFTRALARELGDYGICVNAIAPGYTVTEVNKGKYISDGNLATAFVKRRCFKRDEVSADLMGAILFLSSEESDFITGQTIVVDGGSVFH
jgi:NAD(P)-dependent dehydrogenase (short-subunit alcohol dehydrogenase family)